MSLVAIFFLFSLIILPLQNVTCSDHDKNKDTLNPDEKKALRKFIDNIKHSPRFTWNNDEHACTWKGIICDPDKTTVLYIRLPGTALVGNIPLNSLGKLPNLRVLSLHDNGLFGELPSDFSDLITLTRLYLHMNLVSGQLPYLDAKNLIKLDLSTNKLISSIPHPFSKFPLSSFNKNDYLCGPPTDNICNSSFNPPPDYVKPVKRNDEGEIVGISVASGLVLLILLLCVRKKMYSQTKRPLLVKVPGNKLVVLEDGVYGFRLEDLLTASAEVLGEGSVGTSYKQVVEETKAKTKTKTTVVVKRLKDVVVTEREFGTIMEGLGKVKSGNVVPLIAYYYSEYEKWLVYDYMPGGSLFTHLHGSIGSKRTRLNWDHRMRIAISAARGLQDLHRADIVHGNIKSSNILLRQETDIEASLSDYGLNTLFREPSSPNRHATGYWAPEVFKTEKATLESDVYSFGVLLLELLTCKTAKQASLGEEGVHLSNLVESVVWEEPKAEIFDVELRRDHNIEEMLQLLRIAKDCVLIEPDQRPRMDEVVSMMDNMWLRQSSDDHSKVFDSTPSTDTRDTPSTSTFTP